MVLVRKPWVAIFHRYYPYRITFAFQKSRLKLDLKLPFDTTYEIICVPVYQYLSPGALFLKFIRLRILHKVKWHSYKNIRAFSAAPLDLRILLKNKRVLLKRWIRMPMQRGIW